MMGYRIDWNLTSDLTDEEIKQIKEIVRDKIQPGLKALSLRKREDKQTPLLRKLSVFFLVHKKNAEYYSKNSNISFNDTEISISPMYKAHEINETLIPFKAGNHHAYVLGPQQMLTLATLSVISLVTNKLNLNELEANTRHEIEEDLNLIEKYAGIDLHNRENMLISFEDEYTQDTVMTL